MDLDGSDEYDERLSNEAKVYAALYRRALSLWVVDLFQECFDLATELLQHSDIPIFIRAGCNLFLADRDFEKVKHASEAVRLYKKMEADVPGSYTSLVELAETALGLAQEYEAQEQIEDMGQQAGQEVELGESEDEDMSQASETASASKMTGQVGVSGEEVIESLESTALMHDVDQQEMQELEEAAQQGTKRAREVSGTSFGFETTPPPSSQPAEGVANKKQKQENEDV